MAKARTGAESNGVEIEEPQDFLEDGLYKGIHDLKRAGRAEARNVLRIKGLHSCLTTRCQNHSTPNDTPWAACKRWPRSSTPRVERVSGKRLRNSVSRFQASDAVKPCALSLREAATNSQATCQSSTPSRLLAMRSMAICWRLESARSQA